ncbi:MAG: hypothetical protein JXD23_14230 [Spirochaetales bacterium]|nr:hypothetical protein [Spirochaetales bacterium]
MDNNGFLAQAIKNAFSTLQKNLKEREEKDRFLTNMCIHGAATEHWFKFELVNALQNIFDESGSDYWVIPEMGYRDISVFQMKKTVPLDEIKDDSLVGYIELKELANWHVNNYHRDGIKSDIDKLLNFKRGNKAVKKYLLIFLWYAKPIKGAVGWFDKEQKKSYWVHDNLHSAHAARRI